MRQAPPLEAALRVAALFNQCRSAHAAVHSPSTEMAQGARPAGEVRACGRSPADASSRLAGLVPASGATARSAGDPLPQARAPRPCRDCSSRCAKPGSMKTFARVGRNSGYCRNASSLSLLVGSVDLHPAAGKPTLHFVSQSSPTEGGADLCTPTGIDGSRYPGRRHCEELRVS